MNPRPKTFHNGLYILILISKFRPFRSPSGRIPERLACKILIPFETGVQKVTSPLVDAHTRFAGTIRKDVGLLRGQSVIIIVCDYV